MWICDAEEYGLLSKSVKTMPKFEKVPVSMLGTDGMPHPVGGVIGVTGTCHALINNTQRVRLGVL